MPVVLGMFGAGARDTAADRIIVVSGSLNYDTIRLPTASSSSTSIGGNGTVFRVPWVDDATGTPFTPSTNEFWFHYQHLTNTNGTSNDQLRLGVGRNGVELVAVSCEDNTNKLTIVVLGNVVALAADAFSVSNWKRLHVHVQGYGTGDLIGVYVDGNLTTPVMSYALSSGNAAALASAGKPDEFYVACKSGDSTQRVDDLFAIDPAAVGFPGIEFFASASILEQTPSGNGAENDWSGSFTDIDERPFSDADKRTAGAVGDEFSVVSGAVGQPNVFAVKVAARVTRTGTVAGTTLGLRVRDGTDTQEIQVPAPGAGHVQAIFDVAPDGFAWSPTKRDATRFGFLART